MKRLRSPFPYFGSKSKVADLVWSRFGNVPNFVDPFFGSGSILLARPHRGRIETVNDIDAFICNFFRAVRQNPAAVAAYACDPVIETDLHARHWWLTNAPEVRAFRNRLTSFHTDPEVYDPRIAGWWVWGLCNWIGSGWCEHAEESARTGQDFQPRLARPDLGGTGKGLVALARSGNPNRDRVRPYLDDLSWRLRDVRVCCGDWTRVLGPAVTTGNGLTGVFLDPPYADITGRYRDLYASDSRDVAHLVREWALEHGGDPLFRIALCGYEGEHTLPDSWECVAWKATAGYAAPKRNGSNDNAHRERIWFSPHCLKSQNNQFLF